MASTTQVEFQAVEIISNETARVQALEEGPDDDKGEVATEPSESNTEASEPKTKESNSKTEPSESKSEPSPPAPDASDSNVLPFATAAAAVSFMTLAAVGFFVVRRRSAFSDTDKAIKHGNALDATVTDETASHMSSRSKTNTSEFGAEDMESTSWYE